MNALVLGTSLIQAQGTATLPVQATDFVVVVAWKELLLVGVALVVILWFVLRDRGRTK